ncbi:MAG: hypothetical protein HFJ52_01965 [Clostridia bacterium]|nr:hypothetical protein [Clostridia bacterium]
MNDSEEPIEIKGWLAYNTCNSCFTGRHSRVVCSKCASNKNKPWANKQMSDYVNEKCTTCNGMGETIKEITCEHRTERKSLLLYAT